MLRAIGAIVFVVLAYTVLMLSANVLPATYRVGAAFLMPLIGLAAAWWVFEPNRNAPRS